MDPEHVYRMLVHLATQSAISHAHLLFREHGDLDAAVAMGVMLFKEICVTGGILEMITEAYELNLKSVLAEHLQQMRATGSDPGLTRQQVEQLLALLPPGSGDREVN